MGTCVRKSHNATVDMTVLIIAPPTEYTHTHTEVMYASYIENSALTFKAKPSYRFHPLQQMGEGV